MSEPRHDIPLTLVLPLGVLAIVHALALALGSGGAALGPWGQANVTAALLAVVAFALILRRHREGRARPDPITLAWGIAATDLAAMVVAAAILRPWA
jgi:hypothetical protein